jgi:hypothetical protein
MEEELAELESKLAELERELAALIREAECIPGFGGRYGPHPPLSAAQLKEFEDAHSVVLPAEYREFLTRVGNGGRWPWLVQEPFGGLGPDPWGSWDIRPCAISVPFPHIGGWNDPSGEPVYRDELHGDPEFERQEREWKERYFSSALLSGAIPLHDSGCGRYSWLVVTGLFAGGVWFDCRADRLGIYPITDHDGRYVRFLDWMLLRVDYARRQMRREKTERTKPA